jgi:hypothetical protein
MFKGLADNKLHIGLSRANIQRILEYDPVIFDLASLGLESHWVLITVRKGNLRLVPQRFTGTVVALDETQFEGLFSQAIPFAVTDTLCGMLFAMETEQDIEDAVRRGGLITVGTVVTRKGWPPGSFPSQN